MSEAATLGLLDDTGQKAGSHFDPSRLSIREVEQVSQICG
jgi:hypothetical protein